MNKPNALEKISLSLLSGYKPEDVRHAVKRKARLVDLLVTFLPPIAIKAIRLSTSLYRSDGDVLTPQNVIAWLDLQKPELAAAIRESQENYEWYKRQLRDIKRFFGVG